jgi:pyruvate-formate lyase-activating enzyme
MNSARPDCHRKYYRPSGFSFDDVRQTIRVMKEHGRHVSLNYFILPGFTDDPEEFSALVDLMENCSPDLIQLRNLNMDPEKYLKVVRHESDKPPMGMIAWHHTLKARFPQLKFGYFNPALF